MSRVGRNMSLLESSRIPKIIRRLLGIFIRPDTRASQMESASYDSQPSLVAVRDRLADEKAILDHLDAERESLRNPRFGKAAEDRIVWGELIELELQYLDEQLGRQSGDSADLHPPASSK